MACPRIVGLDVSPVTARSRTYRASAPVRSMTRLMLSSHRLWPSVCSRCAGLSSASMRTSRIRRGCHVLDISGPPALPGAPARGERITLSDEAGGGWASAVRWAVGDGGDLDLRAVEEDRADGGPDRPRMGEVALVHLVEAIEVGQVG